MAVAAGLAGTEARDRGGGGGMVDAAETGGAGGGGADEARDAGGGGADGTLGAAALGSGGGGAETRDGGGGAALGLATLGGGGGAPLAREAGGGGGAALGRAIGGIAMPIIVCLRSGPADSGPFFSRPSNTSRPELPSLLIQITPQRSCCGAQFWRRAGPLRGPEVNRFDLRLARSFVAVRRQKTPDRSMGSFRVSDQVARLHRGMLRARHAGNIQ